MSFSVNNNSFPEDLNLTKSQLKRENNCLKTELIRFKLLSNSYQKYFDFFDENNEMIDSNNNKVLNLKNNIKVLKECQKTCFVSLNRLNKSQFNLEKFGLKSENNLSKAIIDTRDVSTQTQTNELETNSQELNQTFNKREITENSCHLTAEEVSDTYSSDQTIAKRIERLFYRSDETIHSTEVPISYQNIKTETFDENVVKKEIKTESIDCKFFQLVDNSVKIEFKPKLESLKNESNTSQKSIEESIPKQFNTISDNIRVEPIDANLIESMDRPENYQNYGHLSTKNNKSLETEVNVFTISDSEDSVMETNDNSDIVCDLNSNLLQVLDISDNQSIGDNNGSDKTIGQNCVQSVPRNHLNKKYICEQMCGQTFSMKSVLKQHKELHSKIRYRCQWNHCSAIFKKRRFFKKHFNRYHNNSEECPDNEMKNNCICIIVDPNEEQINNRSMNKSVQMNGRLISTVDHNISQKNEHKRDYRCEDCSFKDFDYSASTSKSNKFRDSVDTPFHCLINECNKEFKRKSILRYHQLSAHPQSFTDIPWIRCPESDCNFKSKSKIKYLKHTNQHNFPHTCCQSLHSTNI